MKRTLNQAFDPTRFRPPVLGKKAHTVAPLGTVRLEGTPGEVLAAQCCTERCLSRYFVLDDVVMRKWKNAEKQNLAKRLLATNAVDCGEESVKKMEWTWRVGGQTQVVCVHSIAAVHNISWRPLQTALASKRGERALVPLWAKRSTKPVMTFSSGLETCARLMGSGTPAAPFTVVHVRCICQRGGELHTFTKSVMLLATTPTLSNVADGTFVSTMLD